MTRIMLTEHFTGIWTVKPINGTRGFLHGEQYAVSLALLVDPRVQSEVMGCPDLLVSASNPDDPQGCIHVAI